MTVKKILCAVFAIALIVGATNFNSLPAKADTLDAADLCLSDAIVLMVDEEIQTLSYDRQEIYNYDLQPFGYVYKLELNGKTGFALIILRANYYEVTELYLNKESPFAGKDGLPVYLTIMCYIEYKNGHYIDIENDLFLNQEQLTSLREKGFGYSEKGYENTITAGTIITETITYDSRTVEQGKIAGGVPEYFDSNPVLTGTCAVQAGAVVLGYYGRYFPELTPGFKVGMNFGGTYVYLSEGQSGIIQDIIGDLYVRMGTNVGGGGTTATGFRNGLQSYVNSKNRSLTYTSVASNNVLNYNLFKTQVSNLKPTVLFFNSYNVIPSPPLRTNGNVDTLERKIYPAMHVMIGYGYRNYNYYYNGVNFRNDTYIEVYTGVLEVAQGFIKLYDYSTLVEAYAINIY
jgi:hypothetical protein